MIATVLAACATPPARSAISTESIERPAPREALPIGSAPSRDEVVATAMRYVELAWVAEASHAHHGDDARGTWVDTPDEGFTASGWRVGANVGMPYAWGGLDSPESFAEKLGYGGFFAGYVPKDRSAKASARAAGIDCSGLVARAWRLVPKRSTSELSEVTRRLAGVERLRPGDVLNKAFAHVQIFVAFADDARTRVRVVEAGAWDKRAWKVVVSEYDVDALVSQGFVPLRDARRALEDDER